MHAIEREIIKITKYKVQRKFDDRQDYLRSVLLAVQNLDDSKFDDLSDEAAEWANACVEIENGKRGADLPDFDEVEAEAEPDEVVENDFTEGDSDDDDSDDDDTDDEAEAESDEDEDLEDEDDPPASEDGGEDLTGHEDDPDLEDDDDGEPVEDLAADAQLDLEEEEAPKKVSKKKPAAKKAKAHKVPPKEEKIPNPPRRPRPEPGNDIELDKWGCMAGSKNSKALALFEEGATSGEIKRELGGTYYNVLKKMIEQGHRLEKYGAITKLIHRDELAPKKPKKK